MRYRIVIVLAAVLCTAFTHSCTLKKKPLGTPENPIKLWFMPLKDDAVFKANAPLIEAYLEEKTGYAVDTTLAPSFLDIVKAFGKKKADAAFVNTLGYLLANDWADARPLLQYTYGDLYRTYRGEIIARVGSDINAPEDINGKTFAFVTPYSAGGYLYPLKYLEDHKIKPSKRTFAGGHLKIVEMVYRGEVDAGATYHEHPAGGTTKDARIEILSKYPDILSVVKIVALTDEIPNGPIAVHRDMTDEMSSKLKAAFLEFADTPEGRKALLDLYNITGFVPASNEIYADVGKAISQLGKTIQEMVPGGERYFRTWIMPGLE